MAGTLKRLDAPSGSISATATKRRYGTLAGVTVNTTLGNCDPVDISDFKDIAVKPSASITSLTFYGAETGDGTFVLIDSIGTNGAVTVVASKWNVLDVTKIGAFGFIKMIPNTNGTVEIVAKT